MNQTKRNYLALLVVFALSGTFVNAQSDKKEDVITTKPFGDSERHWYGIKDESNLINPVANQPRYDESDITKIADNMILFQRANGGWPKNYDMRAVLTPEQLEKVASTKSILHTTFDNETTYTHIYYLAQVYSSTKIDKYKEACIKGIQFVLDAQYTNGGWPQYFPLEKNYSRHITFNDGAYMGIMNLLDKIITNNSNFSFLDGNLKSKVKTAYDKGLDCILNMQIKDNGQLTAWCQQHDEESLAPAWARKFEPPSICNGESVGVVLFLMKIKNPDERIVQSIQSAVKWFHDSKILNTRVESFEVEPVESKYKKIKRDVRVVADSTAAPIWTRYYELGTHRPLFCDRNSEFLYSLAEVSLERRSGYAWYTNSPQKVLDKYPDWQKKHAANNDVLQP